MSRLAAGVLAASLAAGPVRAADWAVPEATVRAEAQMSEAPSDPSAGVLAIVPDGGILPRPGPAPVVFDSQGRELKSEVVWHNPSEGLGVVYEPSQDGKAFIYLKPRTGAPPSPGSSKFHTSLLLFTRTGNASLEAAQQAGANVLAASNTVMGPVGMIGQMENPFGSDDEYISYYAGWFKPPSPGKTYICTISCNGSICRVDGNIVANWPGLHGRDEGRKGQFGSMVDLGPGLHKIEYFHFRKTGIAEAQACWKLPDAKGDPTPVTIPVSAYVHSGRAGILRLSSRTGAPLAAFDMRCLSYMWLKDKPVNLFQFQLRFPGDQAKDAVCTWLMENGLQVNDKEVLWLFEGNQVRSVTLNITTGSGTSRATRSVDLPVTPPNASINSPGYRLEYRTALLARCRAVPKTERPCANWSPDLWAILVGVCEPYKGRALLDEIFERSRQDLWTMDPADRHTLEDYFIDAVRYTDQKRALAWLNKLEQEEKERDRRLHWQLLRIEFYLYDLNDSKKAWELAAELQTQASGSDYAVLALIRMGDIQRLQGNAEEATKLYARAQDMPRQVALPPSGGAGGKTSGRLARNKEEWERARQARSHSATNRQDTARLEATREPWKAEAVRASSYYATAHDLIQKGYLDEAGDVLQEWEIEVPLSKMGGDYPLAEAEFYMTIKDYPRAVRVLQAYRKGVEMSPFLVNAMSMELDALVRMNRQDEVKDLAALMIKKFPGHPVAERAQSALRGMGSGGEKPDGPGDDKENL